MEALIHTHNHSTQGPLKVILSIPQAQAGPSQASYSRIGLDSFLVSSRMAVPQSLWTACARAHSLHRKKVFPDVQREGTFCVFCYCPLSLVPALGTAEKSLTLSSVYPPFRYLYLLVRFSLEASLSQAEQLQQTQFYLIEETFQSLNHVHAPYWTLSNMYMSHLQWKIQK